MVLGAPTGADAKEGMVRALEPGPFLLRGITVLLSKNKCTSSGKCIENIEDQTILEVLGYVFAKAKVE